MNPKIVILMEGGTIRDVISTGAVEVAFADYDVGEMLGDQFLLRSPEIDGGQTPVYPFRPWVGEGNLYGQITVDPEKARAIHQTITEHFDRLDQEVEAELLAIERDAA